MWAAIAFSTVIYAVILVFLVKTPRRFASFDAAFRSPLVIGLYIMAAASFLAGFVWPMLVKTAIPRVNMIISLTFFEGCAIFGLMAAFIAGDWRLYLAPWVVALLGFAREFPAAEAG